MEGMKPMKYVYIDGVLVLTLAIAPALAKECSMSRGASWADLCLNPPEQQHIPETPHGFNDTAYAVTGNNHINRIAGNNNGNNSNGNHNS
jgi:hypothetical protein